MYITFEEASRLGGDFPFAVVVKPLGNRCNLGCQYCYYLDKDRFYEAAPKLMSDEVLEEYIKQYIECNPKGEVVFLWHGGEPLMAGLDFFRKALLLQQKHNTKGSTITNTIQTNGTLVTDEWCKFFKENNFLVGLSIDGYESIHNQYRYDKNLRPVFNKVIEAVWLFNRYGVEYNTLSVLTKASEGQGAAIYDFLKRIGVRYMQFLPSVDYQETCESYPTREVISSTLTNDSSDSHLAPWSISSEGYGQFLIDVFDQWVKKDVGTVFVQTFDMTLCQWCGVHTPVCVYQESCGNSVALEHNGDVYSCDHFVFPEGKLGNIMNSNITTLLRSKQQLSFGLNKRNTLPSECKRCDFYFACHGECPKHRHTKTADGKRKYSLCEGVQMFYRHVAPTMERMKWLLEHNRAPAEVMFNH